jgi:hypothetical protein
MREILNHRVVLPLNFSWIAELQDLTPALHALFARCNPADAAEPRYQSGFPPSPQSWSVVTSNPSTKKHKKTPASEGEARNTVACMSTRSKVLSSKTDLTLSRVKPATLRPTS